MLSAIIVAGGFGTRMNREQPKQFLPLMGRKVVEWSLETFQSVAFVDSIVLVLPEGWLKSAPEILSEFVSVKPLKIVQGGKERQDSVLSGLDALEKNCKWVAVHDAARPGITCDIIDLAFVQALKSGNAVPALPAIDTMVFARDQVVSEDIDRSRVFRLQTPQIFRCDVLRKAIISAKEANLIGTDDSGLVRRLGHQIHLVPGSTRNMKITCAEDLKILEALMQNPRGK